MKLSTLNKYLEHLKKTKEQQITLAEYCRRNNINIGNFHMTIKRIRESTEERSEIANEILTLYEQVSGKFIEAVDTNDKAEIAYERDEDGNICSYTYSIYRKNKTPLVGSLSLEEMTTIYRLYSVYGDNLPARAVSRHFPDLSVVDMKRILSAFSIYKVSSPFPPHYYEIYSESELRTMQTQEKENSFLRKAEEDRIKDNEKLLKKYAQENLELKEKLKGLSFSINVPTDIKPYIAPEYEPTGNSINLYLADLHLGSYTTTGSTYKENMNYGFDEAKRRLTEVLNRLAKFGNVDVVNLVLLGDNIDCCGFTGYTARLDHLMPNNMDAKAQANAFLELMMWFISCFSNEDTDFCNKVRVFSVPCGNHAGTFEYMCNKALLAMINAQYPTIETTMWEEYYGMFEQNDNTFICFHGKDNAYCKRGMPLNLDEKTKVLLYEWLDEKHIYGDNIHFIKADLHSNALSSCKKFDYRNVLSLYGASDYSNFNFSRNSYGLSYDFMIDNNLIRGTFENL